jgi:hypothetical protein
MRLPKKLDSPRERVVSAEPFREGGTQRITKARNVYVKIDLGKDTERLCEFGLFALANDGYYIVG